MSVNFDLNGKKVAAQAEPGTPLLWVVRDELGLTGTNFGCAVPALTGKRVRKLPMTAEAIRTA